MQSEKFNLAIKEVFENEGGYVNNKYDRGGETKFGISKRSYPNLDIANLTLNSAKAIYYKDFWASERYEEINDINIVCKLFDLAINMGANTAFRLIQRALRATGIKVVEDGILGNKTVEAINAVDPTDLLAALKSEAAGFYRILADDNSTQTRFLNGWLNRAYS
jgi:lysozyme family protein